MKRKEVGGWQGRKNRAYKESKDGRGRREWDGGIEKERERCGGRWGGEIKGKVVKKGGAERKGEGDVEGGGEGKGTERVERGKGAERRGDRDVEGGWGGTEKWGGRWVREAGRMKGEGGEGGGKREGGRGRGGRGNPEQDAAAAGTFTRWVTSPFHPPSPSKPSPRVQPCYCRSRTFHFFAPVLSLSLRRFPFPLREQPSTLPPPRFH